MPDLAPVPDCEGPQLHPYQSRGTPDITFLEQIGKGVHGHVFKVRIENNIFALKVFNHQIIGPEFLTADDEEWPKIDVKLLRAQWHPFHAECRAYGRLKEAQQEHLAVRCYGHICLTEVQKKELEDLFGIESWWDDDYDLDTTNSDYELEFQEEDRCILRAIVKDFVEGDVSFGPEHVSMMISDLQQLHRLGIIIHDLKQDAYVAGKLVDFSKAVVIPHIMFQPNLRGDPNQRARSEVYEDLARLYDHFREWNEEHPEGPEIVCNPWEIEVAVSRLRRGPLTWQELMARSFNPRRIKWQKFNSRPAESGAATFAKSMDNNNHTGKELKSASRRRRATKKNTTI